MWSWDGKAKAETVRRVADIIDAAWGEERAGYATLVEAAQYWCDHYHLRNIDEDCHRVQAALGALGK